MMSRWVVALVLSALVMACSAEKFVTMEEKANMTTVMEKGTPVQSLMTIGDVEGKTTLSATIPEAWRGPRIAVDELSTRSNEVITMATATIKPPYPASLEATFTISCKKQFTKRPVAARAKILRELDDGVAKEIGSFSTVLGSNNMRYQPSEWLIEPKLQFRCDVLAGLDSMPESMLVYAEMEVLLMPEGTDEGALDPLTATVADPAEQSVISSNPLRINFLAESAAP
jgi:hypothetical protein